MARRQRSIDRGDDDQAKLGAAEASRPGTLAETARKAIGRPIIPVPDGRLCGCAWIKAMQRSLVQWNLVDYPFSFIADLDRPMLAVVFFESVTGFIVDRPETCLLLRSSVVSQFDAVNI